MQTYKLKDDETIEDAAKQAIALANRTNDTVTVHFYNIEFKINPTKDAEFGAAVIVAQYVSGMSEAFHAAADAEQQQEQRRMDEAMSELDSLDFSDLNAVIDWLEKVRSPSEYAGVVTPHQKIVETFRRHGYEPRVNIGKDFNGEDRENFARYLIGQALHGLNDDGSIRQVFHDVADRWRKKFGRAKKARKK